MNRPIPDTRVSISQIVDRYRASSSAITLADFEPLLKHNPLLEKIFLTADCAVAIFDASKAGYLYVSDSAIQLSGYQVEDFMKGGIEFFILNTHPDDLPGIMVILQKELDSINSLPLEDRLNYKSSYDYRTRRIDGSYIHVLQRNVILQLNEEGNMLYMLIIITLMNDFKHDKKLLTNVKGLHNSEPIISQFSGSQIVKESILTRRELEILRLIQQGMTTREIADKLFLSFETVRTHRRNMLEKTNAKNSSKLIHYALAAGLL
jgi:DNA-binding CsgD family transcriptional regulator